MSHMSLSFQQHTWLPILRSHQKVNYKLSKAQLSTHLTNHSFCRHPTLHKWEPQSRRQRSRRTECTSDAESHKWTGVTKSWGLDFHPSFISFWLSYFSQSRASLFGLLTIESQSPTSGLQPSETSVLLGVWRVKQIRKSKPTRAVGTGLKFNDCAATTSDLQPTGKHLIK